MIKTIGNIVNTVNIIVICHRQYYSMTYHSPARGYAPSAGQAFAWSTHTFSKSWVSLCLVIWMFVKGPEILKFKLTCVTANSKNLKESHYRDFNFIKYRRTNYYISNVLNRMTIRTQSPQQNNRWDKSYLKPTLD